MEKQLLSIQPVSQAVSEPDQRTAVRPGWKDFVQLTKPGIIQSNLIAAFGGFWLASRWEINWLLLIAMLVGTTLVMAASCVLNNYWDRDLDRKMRRTVNRVLPAGRATPNQVLLYGIILAVAGTLVLWLLVNPLAGWLGIIGMFVYVIIYTVLLKRTSPLSTFMGSFAGAMPPVIGYTAVTGGMDTGAWILFAILFLWQPPHFWALGIRRLEEYRAAGFKILPVVKGVKRTKMQMLPYLFLLIPAPVLLYVYGYTGVVYAAVSALLGIAWFILGLQGFKTSDDDAWAKKNFLFSVNYLLVTFLLMIFDTIRG